jgi:conjugative transfer signal peptidase TraF
VTTDESAPLIEFCPDEPFASESSKRGYRSRGLICHDRAVPLLKPIVARPGDLVVVTSAGLEVNGERVPNTAPLQYDRVGRPLRAWPAGLYAVKAGTVWVASTYNAGSYDSRYMGPIDTHLIRRRLRPVWCFKG